MICLLSVDRYLGISDPGKYRAKSLKKLYRIIYMFQWSIPVIVCALWLSDVVALDKLRRTGSAVLALATVVIITTNVLIQWKIYSNNKEVCAMMAQQALATRKRQQKRTAWTLAMIVAVFFLCYLPRAVWLSLQLRNQLVIYHFERFTALCAFFNSAINPYLYFRRNEDIRTVILQISRKVFRQKEVGLNIFELFKDKSGIGMIDDKIQDNTAMNESRVEFSLNVSLTASHVLKFCAASNACYIPGFYYDEEKKKYFKITKDHPIPVKKESKPSDDKIEIDRGTCEEEFLPHCKLLSNRETSATSSRELRRLMKRTSIRSVNMMHDKPVKLHLQESNLTGTVNIRKIIPSAKQDVFAVVSKIKGSDKSVLQVYDFKFNKEQEFELMTAYDISMAQISDAIFSQNKRNITNELLICSINEKLGLSQALVFWVDDFLVTDRVIKMKKNQMIWSSCFIRNPSTDRRIAIGATNGILLVGPESRQESHPFLHTSKSDVLTVDCGKTTAYLYAGSRDKKVRSIDLRQRHIAGTLKAKQSVDNVKLLSNENHVLVSTMAGHLELWDVRNGQTILSYAGHKNTHSMLSLHVDGNEDFVASVGEDCIARIWDIHTAELIREFSSDRVDEHNDLIRPSIVFCDELDGSHAVGGFFYGIGDELYYNSL
eukprot:Seg1866.2 transcript_id=Seg1866.2/GoldUCD/mRNA.D3Y31 product="DDB1- and CUL4-associated factor 4" protein_id=Seg1866.2/GoldUCD/D3Y31